MTARGPDSTGVQRPVTLVLAEIAHVLMPTDGIEGRLRRALELLRQIVPYEQCAVVEAVPGSEPRIRLVPEPSSPAAGAIEPALLRLLDLVSGTSLSLRDHPQQEETEYLTSYLAVPLVGANGAGGLLVVSQGFASTYDEDDLRLLSIVASQIAAFLAACRLRVDEAWPEDERAAPREGARPPDERPRVGVQPTNVPRLTKRQLEVARLIASGHSNAQIARELVLTEGTVANHIEHILRRLGASNRAQVAAWVVERALLSPERQR